MGKTKKQEYEQVYEALKYSGHCNFENLCSICQLDNQAIYNALVFLCRKDKVRQEWSDDGVWYSILTND